MHDLVVMKSLAGFLRIGLACVCLPGVGWAQKLSVLQLDLSAQAIGVATRESPAIAGRDLSEGYLTQPVLMAELNAWSDALMLKGTLDLEGATLKRGELNAGIFGEGYEDRRHPHTYLHELVATTEHHFGTASASLTAGKGFAPFGTDDPMSRPFEKYPINHHLAQIPERAIAVAAVHARSLIVEAGAFNGDEPQNPGDTPNRDRYWDSWAGRLTLQPFSQAEIQTSYARVKSPESPSGDGADQRKKSASIRLEDPQHSGYALVEWARTTESNSPNASPAYSSLLAETWAKYGRLSGGLRLESTERPDEQRLSDPFRTAVPASDESVIGRSRWNIVTGRVAASLTEGRVSLEPFLEIAHLRITETLGTSSFDPRAFYGSNRMWSVSVGAKLSLGMTNMRMGRYGAARTVTPGKGMDMRGMPGMKMAADR
jgi:hypothetical protein